MSPKYFRSRESQVAYQEEKLIPFIIDGVRSSYPGIQFASKEVDSGFGIADVVLYNFDRSSAVSRQKSNIPRIKSYEILETLSVMDEIGGKTINITQLYKKLPYSENVFRKKILEFILENNIAEIHNGQDLLLKYRYKVSLRETIAIEAKVSDWKRGLYQAYRYKQYANLSYLALHNSHIQAPKKNIELFHQLNVGLISVDPELGKSEIIFEPDKDANLFSSWVRSYTNETILEANGYVNS